MRATGGDSSTNVTAVAFADASQLNFHVPIIAWTKGSGTVNNGIDKQNISYNNASSVLWSHIFRIGKPFKVTRIYIPFAQAIAANMTLVAKIYTDDGAGTTYTLQTINNINYPGKLDAVLRSDSAGAPILGNHNFWLELKWTGSALCTVNLPIVIQGEVYDE